MMVEELREIFARDLKKLKDEISLYKNEQDIWTVRGDIANPAGNLCLHLVGNLRHFVGAVIGNADYNRNRYQEFTRRNIPQNSLLEMVDETMSIVDATLSNMKEEQLRKTYPLTTFKEPVSTGFFLIHLAAHLSYHLGQINYHRRLLSWKSENSPRSFFDPSIIRSWQN